MHLLAPSLLSHILLNMESALIISPTRVSQGNGSVALDSDFTGSRDRVIRHRLVDRLPLNDHANLLVKDSLVKRWFKKALDSLKSNTG